MLPRSTSISRRSRVEFFGELDTDCPPEASFQREKKHSTLAGSHVDEREISAIAR
jgi:hypothetical protein